MLLDIKLGLAWAIIVALLFDKTITAGWLAAGIAFALLPDLDFWLEYARRGTIGGKTIDLHRTLLHAPLTYIPVALIIEQFFGIAWMTLFAIGVLGHHIHDSMGMGYGVRFLWPFSTRWYKLFSSKDGELHYDLDHLFVSWSDEEMRTLVAERGNDTWLAEDIRYHRTHWRTALWKLALTAIVVTLLIILLPV